MPKTGFVLQVLWPEVHNRFLSIIEVTFSCQARRVSCAWKGGSLPSLYIRNLSNSSCWGGEREGLRTGFKHPFPGEIRTGYCAVEVVDAWCHLQRVCLAGLVRQYVLVCDVVQPGDRVQVPGHGQLEQYIRVSLSDT